MKRSLLKQLAILFPLLCGIASFSMQAMEKPAQAAAQQKAGTESAQKQAESHAVVASAAAQAAADLSAEPDPIVFLSEDLAELELRAQSYLHAGQLSVRLMGWVQTNPGNAIVLKEFIPQLNHSSLYRFLSFFKNIKGISGDQLFGDKIFFNSIKRVLDPHAKRVFEMLTQYAPQILREMQQNMNTMGNREINDPYYNLIDAICAHDLPKIKTLLASGVDATRFDIFDRAPIHYAALCQYADVIEMLVQNAKDAHAQTALVNLKNKFGLVPLMLVGPDSADVRNALEKYGANVNHPDVHGKTPLQTAIEKAGDYFDKDRMVACLVAFKAKVTQVELALAQLCLEKRGVMDIEGKFVYTQIEKLLQEKIKQRIELEKKLAALPKPNASAATATTMTAASADTTNAAAGSGLDNPADQKQNAAQQKEAIEKITKLSKIELDDLEQRAKAYLAIDLITPLADLPLVQMSIQNDHTLLLKEKTREKIQQHRLRRFFSFFKERGITKQSFADQKNLRLISKAINSQSKIIIDGVASKLPQNSLITQGIFEDSLIENSDLAVLIDCLCAKEYKKLKLLLNKTQPNQFDSLMLAPMHYAAMLKDVKLMQELVAAKADVNIMNMHGLSPLLLTHGFMDAEVSQYLGSQGAKLTNDALHNAVINLQHNTEELKLLVIFALCERGVKPAPGTIQDASRLHMYAQDGLWRRLYGDVLASFGYRPRPPMFRPFSAAGELEDPSSLDRDFAALTQFMNSGQQSNNMVSLRGMRLDTKALAEFALKDMGMSKTEMGEVAQDKAALDAWSLTKEQHDELEILSQAFMNGNTIAQQKNVGLNFEQNPQIQLIYHNFLCMFGQIAGQFYNFFFERNIYPEKFIFNDMQSILKTKVGPKAAQAIEVASARLKENKQKEALKPLKFNADKKLRALNVAIWAQDVNAVHACLKDGAEADGEDDEKIMPLHYAIMSAYVNPQIADQLIRILVQDYKVNPLKNNFFGMLPILLVEPRMKLQNHALLEVKLIPQICLVRSIHCARVNGPALLKTLLARGMSVSEAESTLVDKLLVKAKRLPKEDVTKAHYKKNLLEVQKIMLEAKQSQGKAERDAKAAQEAAEREKIMQARQAAREKADAANKERIKKENDAAQKRAEERDRLERERIAQKLVDKEKAAKDASNKDEIDKTRATLENNSVQTDETAVPTKAVAKSATAKKALSKKQLKALAFTAAQDRKKREEEQQAAAAAKKSDPKPMRAAAAKAAPSQSETNPLSKAEAKRIADKKAHDEATALEEKLKALKLAKAEKKKAEDDAKAKEIADKAAEQQKQLDLKRAEDLKAQEAEKKRIEDERMQREAEAKAQEAAAAAAILQAQREVIARDQALIREKAAASKQAKEEEARKAEQAQIQLALEQNRAQESLNEVISLQGSAKDFYNQHVKDFNIKQRELIARQLERWIEAGGTKENQFKDMPSYVLNKYQKNGLGPLEYENRYGFFQRLNTAAATEADYNAWLDWHLEQCKFAGCNTCHRFDAATIAHAHKLCSE